MDGESWWKNFKCSSFENILKMSTKRFPCISITDRSNPSCPPVIDSVKIWSFSRWTREDSTKVEQNCCWSFTQCHWWGWWHWLATVVSSSNTMIFSSSYPTEHRPGLDCEFSAETLLFSQQSSRSSTRPLMFFRLDLARMANRVTIFAQSWTKVDLCWWTHGLADENATVSSPLKCRIDSSCGMKISSWDKLG